MKACRCVIGRRQARPRRPTLCGGQIMLDLTSYDEGVGRELAGLRTIGALFSLLAEALRDGVQFDGQELADVGTCVTSFTERIADRLEAIDKDGNTEPCQTRTC